MTKDEIVTVDEGDSLLNEEDWQIPMETFSDKITSDENLGKLKWKQKVFYKNQNDIIRSLLEAQKQIDTKSESSIEKDKRADFLSKSVLPRKIPSPVPAFELTSCDLDLM